MESRKRPKQKMAKSNNKVNLKQKFEELKKEKVFVVGIISIVSVVFIFAMLLIIFRASTVNVSGSTKYTEDEILSAGGISTADNLLFFNSGNARNMILNTCPYVEEVTIKKVFPSTLEIEVVTAEIFYSFENSDVPIYASRSGKVLESGESVQGSFAIVKSEPVTIVDEHVNFEDEQSAGIFDSITKALYNRDITKINEINMLDSKNITITYDNRVVMELGIAIDLEEKINFGMQIISSDGIGDSEKGVLDLSLAEESNKAYFSLDIEEGQTEEIEIDGEEIDSTESESDEVQRGDDIADVEDGDESQSEETSTDESEASEESEVEDNKPQRGDDIPDV